MDKMSLATFSKLAHSLSWFFWLCPAKLLRFWHSCTPVSLVFANTLLSLMTLIAKNSVAPFTVTAVQQLAPGTVPSLLIALKVSMKIWYWPLLYPPLLYLFHPLVHETDPQCSVLLSLVASYLSPSGFSEALFLPQRLFHLQTHFKGLQIIF